MTKRALRSMRRGYPSSGPAWGSLCVPAGGRLRRRAIARPSRPPLGYLGLVPSPRWLAASSSLLLACGARSALPIDDGAGPGAVPACVDGSLRLAGTVVVDAATTTSEPEGGPTLAWSGDRLFVGWAQWDSGSYHLALAGADLGDGGLTLGPRALVPPGNTNNPFNPQIAWSGGGLDLYWAQDDANIRVQRFDASLGVTVPAIALLGVEAGQLIATRALGAGERALLTYALQQPDGGWRSLALWTEEGAVSGSVADLYDGSGYDFGADLAQNGNEIMALWGARAVTMPNEPIETTLAVIGQASSAPMSMEVVDQGVYHKPSGLAVEEDRISVAMYHVTEDRAVILSRPKMGKMAGAFAEHAVVEATDEVQLAAHPCGGLVALAPTGEMSPNNPLSTGLSLVPIGEDGTLGAPLVLPVTGEYVESWRIVAVEGGYGVAWIEGGKGESPGRVLHMAYVGAR
jgi:hypothetical protein